MGDRARLPVKPLLRGILDGCWPVYKGLPLRLFIQPTARTPPKGVDQCSPKRRLRQDLDAHVAHEAEERNRAFFISTATLSTEVNQARKHLRALR